MSSAAVLGIDGLARPPLKVVRGIPCYTDTNYCGEMDREYAVALSYLASSIGWRRAALGIKSSFVRSYITSQQRSLFLSLLQIHERDRILDVGARWGTIPAQIAAGYRGSKVYAVDRTVECLFFADEIRRQEQLDNLNVIQCDVADPPFEKGFFDIVIMMGVLEWLGVYASDVSPRLAQERALKQLHELMRPGGQLLIGIENRLALDYFFRHPDHTGLAFTSLMPREVATLYMKLRRKGTYRTYTYSRRGYLRLLEDAGFAKPKFYAATPDYRFPERICDVNELKSSMKTRTARLFPSRLIGVMAPSFYILAER